MSSLFPSSLMPAFETCRHIHKKHGKSYYYATRFFPRDKRLATYALYAFFRIPDEMVDTLPDATDAQKRDTLLAWQRDWQQIYQTNGEGHPVLRAAAAVFHRYQIPYAYSERFFEAMIQDTEKTTYATYGDLEAYMYGSAAVVGLMMSYVIGFKDPRALEHAKQLGEAMQLTNFLRDVVEDWDERKRIYLPLEDLARFNVQPEEIASHTFSPRFADLMRFEIARADALYQAAAPGIALLHADGRFAVRAASTLYQAIARKIEQQNYNIFLGRASTSGPEKAWLVLTKCLLSL